MIVLDYTSGDNRRFGNKLDLVLLSEQKQKEWAASASGVPRFCDFLYWYCIKKIVLQIYINE